MADEQSPEPSSDPTSKINIEVPHSARIWNYAWAQVDPNVVTVAKQSRQFLIRAVRFQAGAAGMRQFLEGVTTYVEADFHDPDLIIADARNVLNLSRPVAVMFIGGARPRRRHRRDALHRGAGAGRCPVC